MPTDAVVRGVFVEADGGVAQIEISHVLGDQSGDQLAVGDVIGGGFVAELPCGGTLVVQQDQEVLAVWQRGTVDRYPDCPEYRACTNERCGLAEDDDVLAAWDACDMECMANTRDACLAHTDEARLGGRLVLLPWSDEIDLGAGRSLPASEAHVLSDRSQCLSSFPAPVLPCNDVILTSGCSTAVSGVAGDWAAAAWGWAVGIAFLLRRRRRA